MNNERLLRKHLSYDRKLNDSKSLRLKYADRIEKSIVMVVVVGSIAVEVKEVGLIVVGMHVSGGLVVMEVRLIEVDVG